MITEEIEQIILKLKNKQISLQTLTGYQLLMVGKEYLKKNNMEVVRAIKNEARRRKAYNGRIV